MIKSLRAIIKKGTLYTAAFVLAVSSLSAAVPYMVSETANAVSAPTIHSVRFSTINSTYPGVVIDSYQSGFSDVTSAEFILHRATGGDSVRQAGVDTIAHINAGLDRALTIPFNFNGSGAGAWFGAQNSAWTLSSRPTGVTININTASHGLVTYSTPPSQVLVENNGTYESLVPAPAMPTVTIGVGVLNSSNTVGKNFTVSGNATAGHGLNRVYVQLVNRDTNTRVGGTTINLIGKGGASTWERNYTAADKLPTGTYAAHVEVVDMNGNRSTAGWTANFKLDATDAAFSMTSPSNGSLVKGVQTVRATITDDSDISKVLMTVHLKTGNKTYVWEAGKANNSLTRTGDEYSIVLDTSLLNDGANSIALRATDGAGNTRYWNNNAGNRQHVFTVDNTAPVIAKPVFYLGGGLAENSTVKGTQTFHVTQTEANPDEIYVEVMTKDAAGVWRKNFGQGFKGVNVADFVVNTDDLTEGLHQIKISTKDAAGLKDGHSFTFTVDRTVPTIYIKGANNALLPATTNLAKDVYSAISFKFFDQNNVTHYVLNGTTKLMSPSPWSDGNYGNIKGLLIQGVNTVVLYDAAGNSTEFKFNYDSIAPVASIATSAPASGTITVTGSVDAAEQNMKSHWFEITGPNGYVAYFYDMNDRSNSWSFDWDTSSLANGDYRIRYVATDRAGNRSDTNGPTLKIVSVDNTVAPVVSDVAVVDNGDGTSTVSGVVTPGSDVDVVVDGVVYSATVDANGGWTVSVPNPATPGNYPVSVEARNSAGNTSALASPIVVAAPAAPTGPSGSAQGGVVATTGTGAALTPTNQQTAPQGVLGAQTDADSDNAAESEVMGAATESVAQATNVDAEENTVGGLAWYWWLLIVAAAAALLWWIIAAVRRRRDSEA